MHAWGAAPHLQKLESRTLWVNSTLWAGPARVVLEGTSLRLLQVREKGADRPFSEWRYAKERYGSLDYGVAVERSQREQYILVSLRRNNFQRTIGLFA